MNPPVALFVATGRGIGAAAAGKWADKAGAVAIMLPAGRGAALTQGGQRVARTNLAAANQHAAASRLE